MTSLQQTTPLIDPETKCKHCQFTYRQHGEFSHICPVLVKGLLHQFQSEEAAR